MDDTDNMSSPENARLQRRPSLSQLSDNQLLAVFDSGFGPSKLNTIGYDECANYYSDDSDDFDAASTTDDAKPPGEPLAPCHREDCVAKLAQQMSRITILEGFMQLRARNNTTDQSPDTPVKEEPGPHHPNCIHSQIKILEQRKKEMRELLDEAMRGRKEMGKREAEMDERMLDVAKMLDSVQEKETQIGATHDAITVRMDALDEKLELVKKAESALVDRKKDLKIREQVIEEHTKKLETSQETFKKQSAMLTNMLRQQHDVKSKLDVAKEALDAHEHSVLQREAAVTKREYILVQREKALLAHEQAVHRYVAQHRQSEEEFKQRMQELMQESLQNTVRDLPSEENKVASEAAEEVFASSHPNSPKATFTNQSCRNLCKRKSRRLRMPLRRPSLHSLLHTPKHQSRAQ